jgi:transcriptional regulator with XRE-family HTH domain
MNELLDQLFEHIPPTGSEAVPTADLRSGANLSGGSVQPQGAIKKVNYSHEGMVNLILANRGISQNQLAAHFGYSASWVSQVMSSDAFQAKLAERAAEIEDPTLRATVEDSLKGLVSRSMEIIKEKLKGEAASVPDQLALRTLELSTRALGYGVKNPVVVVNNTQVENHLEVLGGRLTDLLTRKKSETILQSLEPQT